MKTSEIGLKLIERNEEIKREMYHDQIGLPTIGVGHLLTKDELSSGKIQLGGVPIRWSNGLTDAEVGAVLSADVLGAEIAINSWVRVPLTQFEYDALASFVFNVGAKAFAKSTLVRLLNQDKFAEVPSQMRRWIYSKGHILQDLVVRREREIAMWEGVV
jgi:lysozyme